MELIPWAIPRALRFDPDARPTDSSPTLRVPKCPTCGRDMRMTQQTAARRYDALVQARITTFDVSLVD